MGVYLLAKFEVSSIILISFRQGGGNFTPPPSPTSKQTPKNSTQIRVKRTIFGSIICLSQNVRIAIFKKYLQGCICECKSDLEFERAHLTSLKSCTTKHYKKAFLIKQLLSSTNSRFRTQALMSSPTSCYTLK